MKFDKKKSNNNLGIKHTYTHTFIYVCVCVCVFLKNSVLPIYIYIDAIAYVNIFT